MLFGTGVQVMPVAQVFGVVQTPEVSLLQRQMGRQTRAEVVALQTKPGAQSADVVHASPFVFVRDGSGQAQSTWSMLAGIRQASAPGQPPRAPAAVAVGSQLNVQVW